MSDYDKCLILYKKMNAYDPMSSACRKWRHKTESKKTWANCVDHFIEAEVDNSANATAANLGFSNVAVTEALAETRELLANLSTINNKRTNTIVDLHAQLAAPNAALQYQPTYRNQNGGGRGRGRDRGDGGRGRGGRGGGRGQQQPSHEGEPNADSPGAYCHTCSQDAPHNSGTYPNPTPGHQPLANKRNKKRGNAGWYSP